jgi:hypothetical protein
MNHTVRSGLAILVAAALALPGCQWSRTRYALEQPSVDPEETSLDLERPEVEGESTHLAAATAAPLTIADETTEYWDLSLEEVVQWALSNSRVLRDLGGLVLRSPLTARTVHDPAIVETDPRFGVEAALSAFDANFATSAFFEKNDRALNNVFFGGGTRILQQDGHVYQLQLTKRAATGAEFTLRNNTDYDSNNAPGNEFFTAWNTNIEAIVRQPLLQGGGVAFNRIYGPNGIPGLPSGVLLARINTDVSLADFEMGVRNFISDVENAYWDLYFAYRDLDAKISARDAALETWRKVDALFRAGKRGGDAQQEAQAREQYYRFEEEVQNALAGRVVEGTRTTLGSAGGTFRAGGGLQVAERRLRMLVGLPISDGRLIRPSDEPQLAKAVFEWDVILAESLSRRTELRRQKWLIKRRELELLAGKNLLLPRFDAIGRYRWRGFGKDLLDQNHHNDKGVFNNAWGNMLGGQFQEWQLGFEFSMPMGYRRGHVAVRNAELLLARERAILDEQERAVVLDLSNAVADAERAFAVLQTNYNRRAAAAAQLEAVLAIEDPTPQTLYLELDAQRRLADAESQYYRAVTDYQVTVKNVHFEKGSLLEYNGIALAEADWPEKAYEDALTKARLRRWAPFAARMAARADEPISRGPAPQRYAPSDPAPRAIYQSASGSNVPGLNQVERSPVRLTPPEQPVEEAEDDWRGYQGPPPSEGQAADQNDARSDSTHDTWEWSEE